MADKMLQMTETQLAEAIQKATAGMRADQTREIEALLAKVELKKDTEPEWIIPDTPEREVVNFVNTPQPLTHRYNVKKLEVFGCEIHRCYTQNLIVGKRKNAVMGDDERTSTVGFEYGPPPHRIGIDLPKVSILWCDYANPMRRELVGRTIEDYKKYNLPPLYDGEGALQTWEGEYTIDDLIRAETQKFGPHTPHSQRTILGEVAPENMKPHIFQMWVNKCYQFRFDTAKRDREFQAAMRDPSANQGLLKTGRLQGASV